MATAATTPLTLVERWIHGCHRIKQRWKLAQWRLVGPTSSLMVQWQCECTLLLALLLCTVSNLPSVDTVPHVAIYLLLQCLCLSRYIVVRILYSGVCAASSRSPTLLGWISHVATSHACAAGHVCERPHIVKRWNNKSWLHSMVYAILPSGILYGLQWLKIHIWYPIVNYCDAHRMRALDDLYPSFLRPTPQTSSWASTPSESWSWPSGLQNWSQRAWKRIQSQEQVAWLRYHVSLYRLIVHVLGLVLLLYACHLYYFPSIPILQIMPHAHTPLEQGDREWQHANVYQPSGEPAPWHCILFWMLLPGTLASIVCFARCMPPIPDLLTSPTRFQKRLVSVSSTVASSSTTTSTTATSSSNNNNSKKGETYISIANTHCPCAHSYVHHPRVRLHVQLIAMRIWEHVLLCALFPASSLVCRAVRASSCTTSLETLASILYPSPGRDLEYSSSDTTFWYAHMRQGQWWRVILQLAAWMAPAWHVAVMTMALLTAQALLLDRTNVQRACYVAQSWKRQRLVPSKSTTTAWPVWKSRRTYKQGDVVQDGYGRVYQATCEVATDHAPLDQSIFLEWLHDYGLSTERGPLSQSPTLTFLSRMIYGFLVGSILLHLCVVVMEGGRGTETPLTRGLYLTVAAYTLTLRCLTRLQQSQPVSPAQWNRELYTPQHERPSRTRGVVSD
jgi:hypothetical protein